MIEMLSEPRARWVYILAGLVGLVAPAIERRLIGWPVIGALIVLVIAGGLLTTKVSPFTFAGGDWYFQGVIAAAVGTVALAGYVVGQIALFALRGRGA